MKNIIFTIVFLGLPFLMPARCNCQEEFSKIKNHLESNYAGFKDKVTQKNIKKYKDFTADKEQLATQAKNKSQCYFNDNHLYTGLNAEVIEKIQPQKLQTDFPIEKITVSEALIKKLESAKGIEGIYTKKGEGFSIAVLKNKNPFRDYVAVVVKSSDSKFENGSVLAELKEKSAKEYFLLYNFSHMLAFATIKPKDGELISGFVKNGKEIVESCIMDIKSMQEELTFIQNKLNEVHPEPYHFISKADFEQGLARLKSNLKPMTKEQWYVELAGLIAALHDGHTGLYYPAEDRQKYFDLGGKTFPFWVNLNDDGRVVIRQQYLQDDRLLDAAILEINGKPIHEVIEKMYPLTFGEAEVFRNSQISRSFSRMYWLLYGHTDSVVLKTRLASGSIYEKNAACISLAQHDSITKILFPVTTMPKRTHMHFTHLNDRKVGLLTLRDFGTYKGYQDSISNVFKQIQEHAIDTLFLDLRGNGGGEHYITEEINQYLLRVPWVLVSKAKIKMSKEFYRIFPKSVRWLARVLPKKPAIKLAASIMTRNTKIEKVEKVLDSLTKAPTYEIHTRPKLHYAEKYFYSGNVFLLADRNSYSMSGMFAAIMKDYQRAVIVGEETGGLANPHGQNVELTLPHSKFVFYVSTSRAYRPSGVFDNRGVIPDIPISYKILSRANSIEDLISLIAK